MKKIASHITLMLIILLISLPAVQMWFHVFREKPLKGAFVLAERPVFSKKNWDTGEFQARVEKYLKDHAGFRNFLVRVQNQVDYSIFRKANAEGAVIGKEKQLFEYDYIRSWLAIDYPGESFITKKLDRAKYVQEYLKREKGIDLIIVFEPGKASFYPEYIPDRFREKKNGPSTYDHFVKKAAETGLDYIDWQAWFLQLKSGSKYPLFPRYGTHWSVYGMTFAADSMVRFIETRRSIDLAGVSTDTIEYSRRPRDTDDDVASTMNLLFQPGGEELAYPVLGFDTTGRNDKPMVLVVADSYYWNIFNTRIPEHLFANQAFWYFNSFVYPEYYTRPITTKELDLKAEVEKQDIIFLMVTERFLYRFDWTFIDELYALYTPSWLKDPAYSNINRIMWVDSWYNEIITRASHEGISLEQALQDESHYLQFREDTIAYLIDHGPDHFRRMISEDTAWMRHIREKAETRQLTVEDMLKADALYVFMKTHPELYKINRGIAEVEQRIHSMPSLHDSILRESAGYHFDTSLFIRIKASEIYKKEELARIIQSIRKDAGWLDHLKQKAGQRNIPLEEMLRIDAEYIFRQKLKPF